MNSGNWQRLFFLEMALILFCASSSNAAVDTNMTGVGRAGSKSDNPESKNPFSLSYFGILYGPSVAALNSTQPTYTGLKDKSNPIMTKNFLGVGYQLNEDIQIMPTAQWLYQPVQGQQIFLQDPFLRVGDSAVIDSGPFNLYADARVYFGISNFARQSDMLTGFQTYDVFTYGVPGTNLVLGTRASARYNIFGSQGDGNDLELYLAPTAYYQVSPTFAVTLLYEMGASHLYRAPLFQLNNDGTDLEPGVSWDITSKLNVNPYLNFYTGGRLTWESTSVGMTLSWQVF